MLVLFSLYTMQMHGTFWYMSDGTIEKSLKIGVWPATRDKLDHIAAAKRWTLATTVDVLADEFLAKHDIATTEQSSAHGGEDSVES